jgi:hypothetical protein
VLSLNNEKIIFTGQILLVDYVTYTGKIIRIGFRYKKSQGNIEIIAPEPESHLFLDQLKRGEIILISLTKIPI